MKINKFIGTPSLGDEFVLVALEEATLEVDKALNSTLENIFQGNRSINNANPGELIRIFRYPPETQRHTFIHASLHKTH